MNLYWLEQEEADVPAGTDWLSPWETDRFSKFRFANRRADWRLGRWTAKQAVAFCLNLKSDCHSLTAIEICPAPSGVPEVFIDHERAPLSLSLSHRWGRAMCAIARRDVRVGCDLETIETHSEAFISDYFTSQEREQIATAWIQDRERTVSLLWSAKESALKALHEGLRLDTRTVSASFQYQTADTEGWGRLEVCYANQVFNGWWQESGPLVRTIVADTAFGIPICLPIDNCCASELAA